MHVLVSGDDFWGSAYPDAQPDGWAAASVVLWVVLVLAVVVLAVVWGVRNAAVLRRGGLAPLTARSQLAVDLHQRLRTGVSTGLLAPPSLEQRLAELDDLAARGVITEAERAEARLRLLSAPAG
ncbi:hypothetical protein ACUN7V_12530 [Quadrisphaera oryzae]|uniref:hypothetical protein n=1 Tax=Quadrisphaera TaxID=317661 RepID=UPI0016457F96|nr:hypothetical protein [Quadrisphaera sp. RL12-1S]MBC3762031.1 hypothetical protein [Quadrisphaera sp. RL12-1S]